MVEIYETGGSSAATAWPAYTQHCKILLWDIQFQGRNPGVDFGLMRFKHIFHTISCDPQQQGGDSYL